MWALSFLAYEWIYAPDTSAVQSIQKKLVGKSSECPIGSISKQKITKNTII